LARNLPPHSKLARVFGVDQQGIGTEADEERKEYVPSLLHFSAAHGLRDLTAQLLNLPGSVKAFGTPNCNGEYPSNLAENNGHTVLKEFMDNYMEVSALIDHKTRNSSRTSELVSQIVSGHYIANTRCDEIDGFYIDPEIQEVQAVYETLFPDPLDKPARALPSIRQQTTGENYIAMKPGMFAPPAPLPRDLEDDEAIRQAMDEEAADYNLGDDLLHPDRQQRRGEILEWWSPPPPSREKSQNEEFFSRSREPSLHSVPEEKETATKTCDDNDESNRTGAVMATYGEIKVEKRPNYFLIPEQEQLINLQKKVKENKLTINEAEARYKKWKKEHRFSRNNSNFKTQQDRLKKLRLSLEKVNKNKKKGECFQCSGPRDVASSTFADALSKMEAGSVKNKKTNKNNKKDRSNSAPPKADQKTNKFFHFNRRQSVRHSSKRLSNIKKLSDKDDERMDNEYGESFNLKRRVSPSFENEVETPPTPPPRTMQSPLHTQRSSIPPRNAPTPQQISPGSSGYSSSGSGSSAQPPPPLPRRR